MFIKNIKNMQFNDWIFKIYNHINLDYNQVCNRILSIHIYLMYEIFFKILRTKSSYKISCSLRLQSYSIK